MWRKTFSLNSFFFSLCVCQKCHNLFIISNHQVLGTEAQKTILPVEVNQNPSSAKSGPCPLHQVIIIPCDEKTRVKKKKQFSAKHEGSLGWYEGWLRLVSP